jgi:hypothetical protein
MPLGDDGAHHRSGRDGWINLWWLHRTRPERSVPEGDAKVFPPAIWSLAVTGKMALALICHAMAVSCSTAAVVVRGCSGDLRFRRASQTCVNREIGSPANGLQMCLKMMLALARAAGPGWSWRCWSNKIPAYQPGKHLDRTSQQCDCSKEISNCTS